MKLKNFTNDHRLNNRRRYMAETLPIQRKTQCNQSMYLYLYMGRIQEFWLGGGVDFFSKAWGLAAALRPPEGPGQPPGSSQGANPPDAPNFSYFRSKSKTNY